MMGVFSWNGVQSDAFGIFIESIPHHVKAQRKVETYSIPGRNGDLIMPQNAWENVDREYEIILGDGERRSVTVIYDAITDWLCSPAGYCELWDDFDPGHFRLAALKTQIDMESLTVGRFGRAKITFNCKPQRYLVTGKAGVTFSASSTLRNDTSYAARPRILVNGTAGGSGTVTIGTTVFTLSSIPSGGLYIDCEEMDCRDANGNNYNNYVASSTSEFATLEPGNNAIAFTGNVSGLTVTPRWFEI